MAGLSRQGRVKAEKRAAEMSPTLEELKASQAWKPAADQCEEETYTCPLSELDFFEFRLIVRVSNHVASGLFVEFAIVLQVSVAAAWYTVVEFDTSHDDELHSHQYASSTQERVGEAMHHMLIRNVEDVQTAYNWVYTHLEDNWNDYVERWTNG